jgi:hypothetical protein
MKVPDDQLRKMLGITNFTFKQNEQRLAIIDFPLQTQQGTKMLRPIITSTTLGAVVGSVLAAGVFFAPSRRSVEYRVDRQFHLLAERAEGEGRHDSDLD